MYVISWSHNNNRPNNMGSTKFNTPSLLSNRRRGIPHKFFLGFLCSNKVRSEITPNRANERKTAIATIVRLIDKLV